MSECPASVATALPPSPQLGAISDVLEEAHAFFDLPEVAAITTTQRRHEVIRTIKATGTYRQTANELLIGAKIAWRNHARCLGRASWRSLQVLDARDARSPHEIAQACWRHLELSTHGGAIRPLVTVLPQRPIDGKSARLLNPQLIRYAGYPGADGVIGDPLHVELTKIAQQLGWSGAGTRFDVLPLLVESADHTIERFDVPKEVVLEVDIRHPDYPWFADLGLKWHANPAISNMTLDIGGVRYDIAPFSGWYVATEIGVRNFGDTDRYDMLPAVARGMGLDLRRTRNLWKDRALVELTYAVLWSYREAGVHIADHHVAASQFAEFVARERDTGRPVHADWTWVNPPMAPSTTATWTMTFDSADLTVRPNFVARQPPRCTGTH